MKTKFKVIDLTKLSAEINQFKSSESYDPIIIMSSETYDALGKEKMVPIFERNRYRIFFDSKIEYGEIELR